MRHLMLRRSLFFYVSSRLTQFYSFDPRCVISGFDSAGVGVTMYSTSKAFTNAGVASSKLVIPQSLIETSSSSSRTVVQVRAVPVTEGSSATYSA